MSPLHDGFNGPPLIVHDLGRSRGRGWWHRVLIWFLSRPDRREW